MAETSRTLVPGTVDPKLFELLVEGTSIRAPALIKALREHLVDGAKSPEVADVNNVHRTQFYVRLRVLEDQNNYAMRISKFYALETISRVVPLAKPAEVEGE